MNVYCYYVDDIPGLYDNEPGSLGTPASQRALIDIWARSWRKQGWEPHILTEADAIWHPRFDFFKEHFKAKPTEYGEKYTVACWMRWLAMAQVGGGMMVDYDVMAYDFAPRDPNPTEMLIFSDDPPQKLFMGAVLGGAQHYLDMCELFAAAKPCEHDWNERAQIFHQDDLSLLLRMFAGTLAKPDWLKRVPGCALFPEGGWRESPMTHYAFAMKAAGFWPKHQFVEQLRPF